MRHPAVLFALLFAPTFAAAQTVSAEGTELARFKPDQVKVTVFVSARERTAAQAEERAAEYAKDVAEEVLRQKVKGAKVEVEPSAARRTDTAVTWGLVVTITDADPKSLADSVGRVQREGGAIRGFESSQVAYYRTDNGDDATTAALGKATKKATARAESIAAGLGMKLGAVQAADEVLPSADAATSADRFIDGEIVRTVRVRVVYAVTK